MEYLHDLGSILGNRDLKQTKTDKVPAFLVGKTDIKHIRR